jgi:hypothetical protein
MIPYRYPRGSPSPHRRVLCYQYPPLSSKREILISLVITLGYHQVAMFHCQIFGIFHFLNSCTY